MALPERSSLSPVTRQAWRHPTTSRLPHNSSYRPGSRRQHRAVDDCRASAIKDRLKIVLIGPGDLAVLAVPLLVSGLLGYRFTLCLRRTPHGFPGPITESSRAGHLQP